MLQARVTTTVGREQQAERIYVREDRLRQRRDRSRFRKCVARSNEGRVWQRCRCHFEAASLACVRRALWPAIRRCDRSCDVTYGGTYALLPYAASRCQVTLLRTDADTRWADASRPATVCCGARASWHVPSTLRRLMLQALRRRGAVIAGRYMVVRLAAVRDLRAPNVQKSLGTVFDPLIGSAAISRRRFAA